MTGNPSLGLGDTTQWVPCASYRVNACVVSDIGCRRESNEDCGAVVEPSDAGLLAGKGVLVIVADGVGGAEAGEVASRVAVQIVGAAYYSGQGQPGVALESALEEANRGIYTLASRQSELRGMASTCTALAIQGGRAVSAHVGDSRLYLVREDRIYRMTEDHSKVAQMVRAGVLSAEEAHRRSDRNLILRALGSHPEIEVASWDRPSPVQLGDVFVLCTDGLHGLMEDDEIRAAVSDYDPANACELLVMQARNRGGYDNITVAIARIDPAD